VVDYPTPLEEREIVRRMGVKPPRAEQVLETGDLHAVQRLVDDVFVHNAMVDYAVQLVHATRAPAEYGLAHLSAQVAFGASPRASLGLVAASRALALLRGRNYVLPQDVIAIAPEVLRHRVVLSYEALAEGIEADRVIDEVLGAIPVPRIAPSQDHVVDMPAQDTA